MKLPIVTLFILFIFQLHGNGQNIAPKPEYKLDLNSDSYIKIFDGFLLKPGESPQKKISVNNIVKLKNTERLKNIGLKDTISTYLFLSSESGPVREYITRTASLGIDYRGINIPIIVNEKLVTLDDYSKLELIDIKKIGTIRFVKVVPKSTKGGQVLPLGVINVMYKGQF